MTELCQNKVVDEVVYSGVFRFSSWGWCVGVFVGYRCFEIHIASIVAKRGKLIHSVGLWRLGLFLFFFASEYIFFCFREKPPQIAKDWLIKCVVD